MTGPLERALKWAELPARQDVETWEGTTRWGNHDLYPVPIKERTYGTLGYFSYFVVAGVSISGFTTASAFVTAGLSSWETVGAVILGASIAGCISWAGGQPGVDKKLGFTMMARVTFGLWGKIIPLLAPLVGNIVFSGIQAYYGGQAITLILAAVIPQFQRLENTLPLSAAITTRDLIGFLMYFVFYLPVVFYVPMHRLRLFMYPSCVMTAATFIGMLAWAMHTNGGPGPIVSSPIELSRVDRAFKFLQCVSSTAATWGGSGDRLSDWTRFSRKRHSATPALLFGLVLVLTPTAVVGVLVTSAFQQMYQVQIWTPLGMLLHVQDLEYTAACRAASFFAGCGLLTSQIYINISQNTMPFGMDACGLLPKYLSIKRAAVLMSIIAIACNPWRFLSQASIFIQALSVFSVFATATVGILTADYFLVRKRAWKIPDLYRPDGIYWYWQGVNPRSAAAWCCSIIPSLPGFIHSMMGLSYTHGADYKIYQMSFFVGFPIAIGAYVSICHFFPPPALGISEDMDGVDDTQIIEAAVPEGSTSEAEKGEKVIAAVPLD